MKHSLGSLACVLCCGAWARADAVLLSDFKRVSWRIHGSTAGGGFDLSDFRENSTGTDFSESIFGDGSTKEGSADATAEHRVLYSPSSPGLGGLFRRVDLHSFVEGDVDSFGFYFAAADAVATYHMEFELTKPTPWSVDGDGHSQGSTSATGVCRLTLSSSGGGTLYEFLRNGTFNEDFTSGGVLAAGRYSLDIDVEVHTPLTSTSSERRNTATVVFTIPTPGSLIVMAGALVGFARRRRRINAPTTRGGASRPTC